MKNSRLLFLIFTMLLAVNPAYAMYTDTTWATVATDQSAMSSNAAKTYINTAPAIGAATATTAARGTNSTQVATTAYSDQYGAAMPVYISSDWVVGMLPGQSSTTTNTTPLVDGTVYAVANWASQPITIKAVGMRASSTSAGVSVLMKECVYDSDGANGAPGTLLASTAAGTSITDALTSGGTNGGVVTFALDATAPIKKGIFWIAFLQSSTTGFRPTTVSSSTPQGQFFGSTNTAILAGTAPTYGYTVAQAYASGCPSPFGTPVLNSTIGLAPATEYQIN